MCIHVHILSEFAIRSAADRLAVACMFLQPQEAGNVPYVVKGGFGIYTGNRPKKIADTVYDLFSDAERLEGMSKLAKKKSRPEATKLIAKDIGDIAIRSKPELPNLKSSLVSTD